MQLWRRLVNGKRALRGARMLRAGTVTVNSFGEGDITTPFGGYKQSGNGREFGIFGFEEYLEVKPVYGFAAEAEDLPGHVTAAEHAARHARNIRI